MTDRSTTSCPSAAANRPDGSRDTDYRDPPASRLIRRAVEWRLASEDPFDVLFAVVAGVFLSAVAHRMPENEVRALTFVSLVLANFGLILVKRSFGRWLPIASPRSNRSLWVVLGTTATILAMILGSSFGRGLFGFGPLHADDLLVSVGASLGVWLLLEQLKPRLGTRMAC